MKYRIRITTYKNGRQSFSPQVRGSVSWKNLDYVGKICSSPILWGNREDALTSIDNHFWGNSTIKSIEFEYIEK